MHGSLSKLYIQKGSSSSQSSSSSWINLRSNENKNFDNFNVLRNELESLGKELEIKNLIDWYGIRKSNSGYHKVENLISRHGRTLPYLLLFTYPEHNWNIWKFEKLSENLWEIEQNRFDYLEWLAKELGIKTLEDWYRIKIKNIKNKGIESFLQLYKGSLGIALCSVYKEHNWQMWRFEYIPNEYWNERQHCKWYLQSLGKELGLENLDDWYKIKTRDILHIAKNFLRSFSSLRSALQFAFPEHNWQLSKFGKVPTGYWKDPSKRRQCMDQLGKELGIKHWQDWYKISNYHILSKNGGGLLRDFDGSLSTAVKSIYPEYKWQIWKWGKVPF
jgi:hypothetical protein